MPEFSLFRVHVQKTANKSLWGYDATPSEILREVLSRIKNVEYESGGVWHIGNVNPIDSTSVYLRIGKTKTAIKEVFIDGAFQDVDSIDTQSTHIIFDTQLEILAIGHKTVLARDPITVARMFIALLERADFENTIQADLEVKPILNPEQFLKDIRNADTILKFWITIQTPNAFDTEKDFQGPLEQALKNIGGQAGKMEVIGELEPAKVEDVARGVAAQGLDAGATFKPKGRKKTRKSTLKRTVARTNIDNLGDEQGRQQGIDWIRDMYSSIRRGQQ